METATIASGWRTYRTGRWLVIEIRGIDPSIAASFRKYLESQREGTWGGLILDVRGAPAPDGSGRLLLANLQKSMGNASREMAIVSGDPAWREVLGHLPELIWMEDLSELRRGIHEMTMDRRIQLETLGRPVSNLLALSLRCPVCGCESVDGWMPHPDRIEKKWKPDEVTIQLIDKNAGSDSLDVETYRVAVCPSCLFASSRLDWFDLIHTKLRSSLPDRARDRLAKGAARRRDVLVAERLDTPTSVYVGMPRQRQAARFAWILAEESLRDVGRDRQDLDAFGVAFCHLMQARFAPEGRDLSPHFSAAYIWLREMTNQEGSYAVDRLAEAGVYLVSVQMALGRDREAMESGRRMLELYGADPSLDLWAARIRELLS